MLMPPITPDEERDYNQAITALLPKPRQISGLLWHYTSGQALIDILKDKSLWATHISCLNDSSEFRHALGKLRPNWPPGR